MMESQRAGIIFTPACPSSWLLSLLCRKEGKALHKNPLVKVPAWDQELAQVCVLCRGFSSLFILIPLLPCPHSKKSLE